MADYWTDPYLWLSISDNTQYMIVVPLPNQTLTQMLLTEGAF